MRGMVKKLDVNAGTGVTDDKVIYSTFENNQLLFG